ncbi:MAG: rhodanese-like domain-containing protein [Saccharofermentans sp.]|nr:rhodanese-like domain-containing protein [Saccharofermentans sp.]
MKKALVVVVLSAMVMSGCSERSDETTTQTSKAMETIETEETTMSANTYTSISMDEARTIFEQDGDYIIVDVRRADEFAEGHIPGAINIANESISTEMPSELPDKNQVIYIYCRSGNRSKQASEKLAAMGYTNIIELGGIIDWTGDVEY